VGQVGNLQQVCQPALLRPAAVIARFDNRT
jgi:hypothetical protein